MSTHAFDGDSGWPPVLDWYRRHAKPGAVAPELGHDLVICLDDILRAEAESFGQLLGRPVCSADASAGQILFRDDVASALVLSTTGQLSTRIVRDWTDRATRAHTPVGFVLAGTSGEAGFLLRKFTMAHLAPLALADGLINTDSARCGALAELKVARTDHVAATLAADWRVLAIRAPSRLAHMNLGSHSVCGATSAEKVGERTLAGGCDPGRGLCRGVSGFQRQSAPISSIKALVLILMGCGTFDLTGEHYPTDASLASGALRGYAAAAIGSLDKLHDCWDSNEAVLAALAAGMSLGAMTLALNDSYRSPGGCAFALAGDPAVRVTSMVLEEPDDTPADPGNGAVAAEAAGMPAASFDPRSRAIVAPAITREDEARARALRATLQQALQRARNALGLHRALTEFCADATAEQTAAIEELARCGSLVEAAAWTGLEDINIALEFGRSYEPDAIHSRLDTAMRRWDEALITLACTVNAMYLHSALHRNYIYVGPAELRNCGHCGAAVTEHRFEDSQGAGDARLVSECQQCDANFNVVQGGVRIEPRVQRRAYEPGDCVPVTFRLTGDTASHPPTGPLAIILSADSMRHDALDVHRIDEGSGPPRTAHIEIPSDADNEFFPLWLIHSRRLQVTFGSVQLAVCRLS